MELIENLGITAVPVITVIVFLIAEAVKATPLDNKWLPVICGFCGGVLGVVAVAIMPEFPAKDYMTAVAVGIVSGLAATGVHQIYKQLTKKESGANGPVHTSEPDTVDDTGETYTAEDIIRELKDE